MRPTIVQLHCPLVQAGFGRGETECERGQRGLGHAARVRSGSAGRSAAAAPAQASAFWLPCANLTSIGKP
eukprot:1181037-Prorocentrum_minimum.AAC.4